MWPVKELPSRWDIDEVTTDHPVFLERVDGHIAVANTRALQLASITVASKDPAGGKIDRDTTGQATGILRETARQAVTAVIPKPNHDQRRQAIEAGLQELARSGITSAQDNSDSRTRNCPGTISRSSKKLSARANSPRASRNGCPSTIPWPVLQEHRAAHPQSDKCCTPAC